jgi:hypothetical protein
VDLNTFIIAVFYEVDNWFMGQKKLRGRGPEPELSDSEVLTMEIVGEFLGIDSEKGLSTPTSGATTLIGSRLWGKSTAPPSPARWPTCGSPRSGCGESCYAGLASIRGSP